MRLQLDATPRELAEKGPDLIKALAERLAPHHEELAQNLEKALRKEPQLKYPSLQDLYRKTADEYQRQSLAIVSDIETVLGGGTPKSLKKADKLPGGLADKKKPSDFDPAAVAAGMKVELEHTNDPAIAREIAQDHLAEDPKYYEKLKRIHKAEEGDDPDYDPESGEPIFDPKTGMSPSETAEAKERGELEEEEDTEKSVSHFNDRVPVDAHDGDDDELAEPAKQEDETQENEVDDSDDEAVESSAVGKSLEEYPMAPADELAKAGPHKYVRRWKDAKGNWQYEYPDKPSGKPGKAGQVASEDPGERWDAEKAHEKMVAWADSLYESQALNPNEVDNAGFNRNDMQKWKSWGGRTTVSVDYLRRLLKKYRRQISGMSAPGDYYRAGLGDVVEAAMPTVKIRIDLKRGDVELPVDGRIKGKAWNEYLALMRELKADGLVRFNGQAWTIPADQVESFSMDRYGQRLEAMGLRLEMPAKWPPPESLDTQKRKKELTKKTKSGGSVAPATADQLIEGIARRQVHSTIVVKRHSKSPGHGIEAGGFTFHSPFSPEYNNLFSNKSGELSGITEYKRSYGHARLTYSLELAEEAIDKLKAVLPDWKIVTEGVREAQEERERRQAELRKPIPEIQKVMGDDPVTGQPYKLFPYQNEGVKFIQDRKGRAIIGDEMGVGKTLQALGYAAAENRRMLAVVPKVVRRQWLDEAHKFFPGHFQTKELVKGDLTKLQKNPEKTKREYVAHLQRLGDDGDLSAMRQAEHYQENLDELPLKEAISWKLGLKDKNLVSVNYEAVEAYLPYIEEAGLNMVVIDESDRAKNPKAKITRRLSKLVKKFQDRILMSGTVIRNKRDELFTQAEMVEPGLFREGELKGMGSTIGGAWHKARKIMISRQKKDVLPDLPPKTTTYSRQAMKGIPDIKGKLEIGDISRLKSEVAIAKAPYTADLVKQMLTETDGKIIIFSDLTEAAKVIADKLGSVAVLHHGGLSDNKRANAVSSFQDATGGPRVFVSTTGSAGVGLNLQVANQVVFNDDPWTGAAMRQAEDRAHRATSTQPVNVLHVTAADNAWDETVSEILQRKLVLHAKMQHGKQLTPEERAWEKTPVTFAEILKQLQGEPAQPAVQASGSDPTVDEGPVTVTPKAPKTPTGFKIPEPPPGVVEKPKPKPKPKSKAAKPKPEKPKDAVPKPIQPVERKPMKTKPGNPEQLKLFKAQFAEISDLFGEPFAYDYMVVEMDMEKSFKDHTQAIVNKDNQLYQQAKQGLMELDTTLTEDDFSTPAGRFYGWSTNQLVDYARSRS